MYGLFEGRIVHFVLDEGRNKGEHRPAIVVKVWRTADGQAPENGCSQLQVFTDKANDELPTILLKTSVTYDESGMPGSWHWIEQEMQELPVIEKTAAPVEQPEVAPPASDPE